MEIATPEEKVMVIQELRQEYKLDMLLEIAQLPRSTFYYHNKRQGKKDKYVYAKAELIDYIDCYNNRRSRQD